MKDEAGQTGVTLLTLKMSGDVRQGAGALF